MRKDVKVGLASGAVLLAVIIVYFSSLNKMPNAAKPGARLVTTTGQAGSTGSVDHGTVSIAMGDGTGAAASGGASAPGESDWAKLLGEGAPPSLMTHTPVGDPTNTPDTTPAATGAASTGGDVFASRTSEGTSSTAAAGASGGSTAVDLAGSVSHPTPAPRAVSAASTTGMHTYVVKENQSFSTIASELYGSPHFYPHIMRANPGIDPLQLRPGMTINVPDVSAVKPHESVSVTSPTAHEAAPAVATGEYRVQSNDSLYRIAMKVYGSPKQVDAIYQLNKSTIGDDPARLKVGMVLKLPSKQ